MEIQTVAYTGLNDAIEITLSDGSVWYDLANNPPDNEFRRALKGWLDVGGIIAPFVPPPPVIPTSVSRAQALMALYNAGLLQAVKDEVYTHPYTPITIWFENATTWDRYNPYVLGVGIELGLSDEAIDGLFKQASLLG